MALDTSKPLAGLSRLPTHVGIIMDGNGRWAQRRGKPRSAGHREGLEAAKRIVKTASDLGLRFLTLYVFSTENWNRAEDEVSFLMKLIAQYLKREYAFYRRNHIRVVHTGNIETLPVFVQREIQVAAEQTRNYDGLIVNLAINYGGRDEIIRSINRWLARRGDIPGSNGHISEQALRECLDCPEIPDPDLIIRTAGEQRLSNFLLWESAYSEYYFSSKLWPDWTPDDFTEALKDFSTRTRTFGGGQ